MAATFPPLDSTTASFVPATTTPMNPAVESFVPAKERNLVTVPLLLQLPNEILVQILLNLIQEPTMRRRSLRLACRKFAEVVLSAENDKAKELARTEYAAAAVIFGEAQYEEAGSSLLFTWIPQLRQVRRVVRSVYGSREGGIDPQWVETGLYLGEMLKNTNEPGSLAWRQCVKDLPLHGVVLLDLAAQTILEHIIRQLNGQPVFRPAGSDGKTLMQAITHQFLVEGVCGNMFTQLSYWAGVSEALRGSVRQIAYCNTLPDGSVIKKKLFDARLDLLITGRLSEAILDMIARGEEWSIVRIVSMQTQGKSVAATLKELSDEVKTGAVEREALHTAGLAMVMEAQLDKWVMEWTMARCEWD